MWGSTDTVVYEGQSWAPKTLCACLSAHLWHRQLCPCSLPTEVPFVWAVPTGIQAYPVVSPVCRAALCDSSSTWQFWERKASGKDDCQVSIGGRSTCFVPFLLALKMDDTHSWGSHFVIWRQWVNTKKLAKSKENMGPLGELNSWPVQRLPALATLNCTKASLSWLKALLAIFC